MIQPGEFHAGPKRGGTVSHVTLSIRTITGTITYETRGALNSSSHLATQRKLGLQAKKDFAGLLGSLRFGG